MENIAVSQKKDLFSAIPSIDICKKVLIDADEHIEELWEIVHPLVTQYWDLCRQNIQAGRITSQEELSLENNISALKNFVYQGMKPKFRRVLNATGVVVHTNMGRSTLCKDAQDAVACAAKNYTNLELDLHTGGRGSRYTIVEEGLSRVTGAEAAVVVNNNAAAVMLMLDTFCAGGEVVVSRGELVEIGGSFRIPDVMAKSGARLREVGATNRTHLGDYAQAITSDTRALMRVHTSNYRIIGFHERVPLSDLSTLAHEHNLLLMEDLGSGSLVQFADIGLPDEPTVQETVQEGVDLVSFSGDKVLGGPQAGIIVGRKELIDALKKNPLTRALRCDKLCMAALEATVRVYIRNAMDEIPTVRRIRVSQETLRQKAEQLRTLFAESFGGACAISVVPDVSRVGGGAFPQYDLPTYLVALKPVHGSAENLKSALLKTDPPLAGRLERDAFCLDPRTLEDEEYPLVVHVLQDALKTL